MQASNTLTTVTVTGTDELRQLLNRASRSLTKKEVASMLRSAAAPMRRIAKQDALMGINPRRKTIKGTRSGSKYELKPGVISRSIGIKTLKTQDDPVVIVAPIFKRDRNTDPWFSHFIHSGTVSRQTAKGKSTGSIDNKVEFMNRAGSESMRAQVANDVSKRIIAKLESIGL
jgi:hypothetical protein